MRGDLNTPAVSPYRDRPMEESLDLFARMRAGEFEDNKYTLRAKIDLASGNFNMRDPVIYRIRHMHHHRQGDKWCIYPLYDYAHPIQDALEGITHSLCSIEFENHRPLYDWVVDRLDEMGMLPIRNGVKIRTEQREFARLNITYTVMSKRLLLQLVTDGHVNGWDDPRMPTVCGMRRRGYTPGAIREFCERVGVTKVESESDPALLEWCVREELNKTALRRMAVVDPVKVVVDNWAEGTKMVELPNNPLDESAGMRQIPFGGEVWIDRADFMEVPEKKFFRMAPGQEVRLRGACIFRCTGCVKNDAGEVVEIHGTWDPESWGGNAADGRKVKGTIHWVDCSSGVAAEFRLYDKLFTEKDPLKDGSGEFLKYMNPESLKVVNGYVEPLLAEAKGGERFQFERTGYFVADRYDHSAEHPVFNRSVGLRDSWAKMNK